MTNHEPKHPPADMAGLDGLIERLRAYPCEYCDTDCTKAADRIEALEAENERLQQTGAFLLARLDDLEWLDGQLEETARDYFGHVEPAIYHFRAALGEKQ